LHRSPAIAARKASKACHAARDRSYMLWCWIDNQGNG